MRTKAPDPSVRSTVIRLRVTEAEVELFKRKAREAGCMYAKIKLSQSGQK